MLQHFWKAVQIDASNPGSAEIPTATHPPPWTIPAPPRKAWGLVEGNVDLVVPELLLVLPIFELISTFSMATSIRSQRSCRIMKASRSH